MTKRERDPKAYILSIINRCIKEEESEGYSEDYDPWESFCSLSYEIRTHLENKPVKKELS